MKRLIILTMSASLFLCGISNEINWSRNLEESLKDQKSNGKDILIYFGASWSSPCKRIEENVLSSSKFIDYSQKFEMVKIYDDFKKEEKDKYDYCDSVRKAFGIYAIPAFVIIKNNHGHCKMTGTYSNPDELIKKINSCN